MIEVCVYKDGEFLNKASGRLAVGNVGSSCYFIGSASPEELSNALIGLVCSCDLGTGLNGELCADVAQHLVKATLAAKNGDLSEMLGYEEGFSHE